MLAEPPVLVVSEVVNKGNFTVWGDVAVLLSALGQVKVLCVPKMLDFSVCGADGSGAPCPCPSSGCLPRVKFFLAVASAELSGGPDRLAGVSLGLLTRVFPQIGITLGNSSLRIVTPSLLSPNRSSTISATT